MAESLKNRIIKTELINWNNLKWFQPTNLKSMKEEQLEKIKKSLINNGMSMPFTVWQKDSKNLYCLDGHHRLLALQSLIDDGHEIPNMLPANFIECKDNLEAKKIILIFNSHYAKINKTELYEFISDIDIDDLKDEIEITDIDLSDYEWTPVDNEKEIDENSIETENECPKCNYVW